MQPKTRSIYVKPHSAVLRLLRPAAGGDRAYLTEDPRMARLALKLMEKVSRRGPEHFWSGDIKKREARLALLTVGLLSLSRTARILDIGCRSNRLVIELQKIGFKNSKGIDMEKETGIADRRFGQLVDFFDLPMNEIYDMIHTRKTLDFMEGGNAVWNCSGPPIALYARHIFFHLRPGGFLIFSDFAPNIPEFIEELKSLGFTRLNEHRTYYYIFQKPN